jgi:hypothetical protein
MFATLTQSSNNSKNSAPAETFGEAGLLTSASPLGYLGNSNLRLTPYPITFAACAPPGAGDAEVAATAPVQAAAPSAVYMMNRKLGAGPQDQATAKDALNVLSHTFVYTTGANGTLLTTYSWGNDFNPAFPSHWYFGQDGAVANDAKAAQQGIADLASGHGPQPVLQPALSDRDVQTAFTVLSDYPEGGSWHKWMPGATCKEEAAKLIALAAVARANNDAKDAVVKYVKSNVWVIGGYVPRASALAQGFLKNLNADVKTFEAWMKDTSQKMQSGAIAASNEIKQAFQQVVGTF